MNVRYMLVLPRNEGIICVGPLPRAGEQVFMTKLYGEKKENLYLVVAVRYVVRVENEPYDTLGTRGRASGDLPEVYVTPAVEIG